MNPVMLGWTLVEIAEAVGGVVVGDDDGEVSHIETDTRRDVAGGVFVALVGEHFNGHSFAHEALERGAVAVIVQREANVEVTPRIEVESTGDALFALGVKRRNELDIPVVAITGSAGKTSTKDLLAAGIPGSWAAPHSYNNDIGVPLTVLATPPGATALIFEAGCGSERDIELLGPAIRPDVAVITNIGTAHMERFGSRRDIEDAKYELVTLLGGEGTAILPVDEPALQRGGTSVTLTFGEEAGNIQVRDISTDAVGLASFTLETGSEQFDVSLSLAGRHQSFNAACAVGAAIALGIDVASFVKRIESATGSAWRMDVHTGRFTVVNDAYNASPQAVASAFETVSAMDGRPIAVLGAMAELGPVCGAEHARMGRLASNFGFKELLIVGIDHGYAEGFSGSVHRAADIEKALDTLSTIIEPGDVVLVKAARSARLERLARALIEEAAL